MENAFQNAMAGTDELLVEAQNIINEINAFMSHFMISGRKLEFLTSRANEIIEKLKKRIKIYKTENEALYKEEISIIMQKIKELQESINNLKNRFEKIIQQSEPQ